MVRSIAILLCLFLMGCPGAQVPDLQDVGGTVTLDGTPVEGATVMFTPLNGEGRSCMARTDADGKYVLRFSSKYAGVPKGEFNVTVSKILPSDNPAADGKELLPRQYQKSGTIVMNITEANQDLNLELVSN